MRQSRVDASERAQQRRVVLLLDQPADGEGERRLGGIPAAAGVGSEGAAGSSSSP